MKRYFWGKLTESDWNAIILELMLALDKYSDWILVASADDLVAYLEKKFFQIRSSYLRPTWIQPDAQPFFNKKLNVLISTFNFFPKISLLMRGRLVMNELT